MASSLEVIEAMDYAKHADLRFSMAKNDLCTVLKSYALYEIACLCRKHKNKEVLLTSLPGEATLYVSGVLRKASAISKRFNVARARYGQGSYPVGVFLGLNDTVSFKPML